MTINESDMVILPLDLDIVGQLAAETKLPKMLDVGRDVLVNVGPGYRDLLKRNVVLSGPPTRAHEVGR